MEKTLDVRDLAPPEPLERILDALADLPPGHWLKVQHSREPFPLYDLLKGMGYLWDTQHQGRNRYEIYIWPEVQSPPPAVSDPAAN